MFRKIQKLHFVGIGGIGMSGIAELLLNLGYAVTGSDLKSNTAIARLKTLGGNIVIGHRAENVDDADVVVISSAVHPENTEVMEAKRRQIPVIPRAEMLAELMRLKYGIAVAGAHGKTTTTSMIASVLVSGGVDPTAVIGGRLNAFGSNAKLGKGDFIVAEADESDGSFLMLNPAIAVITNIDREHLDYYGNLEDIQSAFVHFANKVPFYGAAVLCLDDPSVQAIVPRIKRRIITYGTSNQSEISACSIEFQGFGSSCKVRHKGKDLGMLELRIPGKHGILNALAAVATALELDIPFEKTAKALKSFQNADRRFQIRGEKNGILVVDDYGHHPTEIIATLSAARQACNRRIVAVFQPHRFSRTRALAEDFSRAFNNADSLLVLPIYAAGEEPLAGITAEGLAEMIKESGHRDVCFAADFDEALRLLRSRVLEGDLLITLGAGDIWKIGEAFLK
ncbi:MAG TPA: UDP-N-acetylmuramate--L-alanine ligase [Acidobacteriota bacterium]|nr:UDP-N-acetylmuramate--L-alanine ligase [Acidobacteriota bacterium]